MQNIWELKSIKEAATRPEFYQFLNIGLKDLLFKAYREQKTTYQLLVKFEESTKNKEGYPSLGSVSLPKKVLEGEPFQESTLPRADMVELTNGKYGEIISISQDLIDDDQTQEIKNKPLGLGQAHAKHEDKTVYSILNGNATGYDSQAIFSLNHPGFVGGSAIPANDNLLTAVTLSANAVAQALGIIGRWTGHSSEDILDVVATDLIVPVNLAFTAKILTESDVLPLAYAAGALGPGASVGAAKNVLRDAGLGVIQSPRLDGTSTTDWYIKTDFPGFVFQWRLRLILMKASENSDALFIRDLLQWRSKARWATDVINWRFGMKVS